MSFPFECGIPFAKGAVPNTSAFRLETIAGVEVPAQFRSLVNWADGSVKAVQMVTIRDGSQATYNLRYGPGASRSTYTSVTVTDAASYIEISTGVISFRVNKTAGYLFAQVVNGTTQLLTNSDIIMNNYNDGLDYKSSLETSHVLTVEETGPIRAVLLHTGSLRNAAGTALCKYRARYYAYVGLDHIKLDLTVIDDATETDRGHEPIYYAAGVPTDMQFRANSYYITMPYFLSGTKTYHFGGNASTPTGTVSGEHYLHQFGNDNIISGTFQPQNFYIEGVQSSSSSVGSPTAGKMDGWLNVYNGTHSIYAGIREAWQRYPKEVQVDHSLNAMRVSLHPLRASQKPAIADPSSNRLDRPRIFYFPRHGGACTNQVLFQFRAGAQQGTNLMAAFNAQPRMLRPASEMCASKVFGDMLEAGTDSAGFDDWMLQAQQRCFIDGSSNPQGSRLVEYLGGIARLYSWRDYGCSYYQGANSSRGSIYPGVGSRAWFVNYNGTHISTGMHFLKEYIRTRNENLWWKSGETQARHFMDFDVSHGNRLGGSSNSTANIGAGEIHSQAHSDGQYDHTCGFMGSNHASSGGLGEYYLLTGDYRALEVMDIIATWQIANFNSRYPVPFSTTYPTLLTSSEEHRNWHFPFQILLQYFKATGNIAYLNKIADRGGKFFMQWFRQTGYGHVQAGVTVHANSYTTGRAAWFLPRNSGNAAAGVWNGGSSWMIAPMLCTIIDYFEVDKDYNTIITQGGFTRADWQDLILQNTESLARHHFRRPDATWAESWTYDESRSTVTTEYGQTGAAPAGAGTTFGGTTTVCGSIPIGIPYCLAYATKLITTGDGAGTPIHPNPAWWTKSALWSTLANCTFNELKTIRPWPSDQYRQVDPGIYGWYGYEHGYKMGEFFKLMSSGASVSLPTVSLSASSNSITSGQSVTLTWTSANATSVVASGAWSGTKAANGSEIVSPTSTGTYTLTATNSAGSAADSETITVSAGTIPTYQTTFSAADASMRYENGGHGFGNNELQYYTTRVSPTANFNISYNNPGLNIIARSEVFTGTDGTRNYTSARLFFRDNVEATAITLEVYAQVPYISVGGICPAFWLNCYHPSFGTWAQYMGEFGFEFPDTVGSNTNINVYWINRDGFPNVSGTVAGGWNNGLHYYRIVKGLTRVRWYIDNVIALDTGTLSAQYQADFQTQPFYPVVNTAVGGNLPGGLPSGSTGFPNTLNVRSLKVWYGEVTP